MTEAHQITFNELSSDPMFQTLIDGYADESAMEGLPPVDCQYHTYEAMCAAGIIFVLGAYHDDILCGFAVVITSIVPHYGVCVAATESFFVAPDKRDTGAGLMLLRKAERVAQTRGAVGFLVSAPTGGRLEDVMIKSSTYKERNRVFFKGLV
jgi:GNAT superfamily N-acetyltransferase|tara:strand:- start:781 stop:1236 length:456 start_codon:yes stop_codon:yes gene_type:complete